MFSHLKMAIFSIGRRSSEIWDSSELHQTHKGGVLSQETSKS